MSLDGVASARWQHYAAMGTDKCKRETSCSNVKCETSLTHGQQHFSVTSTGLLTNVCHRMQ